MGRLAILACSGTLPVQIARAHPDALTFSLAGVPHQLGATAREHRIEKMGALFEEMKAEGVDRLVFAGSLARPNLDPAAFDRYYNEIHVPLAKKMQGLKKWTIGHALGTPDGKRPEYYYIADLYADSREELEAIFETPEGKAAVEDVPKFASGGVMFIYTDVEDVI